MAEATKEISAKELDELVKKFHAIADADQKAKFYHENPALHVIFRGGSLP